MPAPKKRLAASDHQKSKRPSTVSTTLDSQIRQLKAQIMLRQEELIDEVQDQDSEIIETSRVFSGQIDQVVEFLRQFQRIINQIIKENQRLNQIIKEQENNMESRQQEIVDYLAIKEERILVLTRTISGYKHVNEVLTRIIKEMSEEGEIGYGEDDEELIRANSEAQRLHSLYQATTEELEAERLRFQEMIDHYEQHMEEQRKSITNLYLEKISQETEAKETALTALGEERVVGIKANSKLKQLIGEYESLKNQTEDIKAQLNVKIDKLEKHVEELTNKTKEQANALSTVNHLKKMANDAIEALTGFNNYLQHLNDHNPLAKRTLSHRIFSHALDKHVLNVNEVITPSSIASEMSLTPTVVYSELKDLEKIGAVSFEKGKEEKSFHDYPLKFGVRKKT